MIKALPHERHWLYLYFKNINSLANLVWIYPTVLFSVVPGYNDASRMKDVSSGHMT